MSSVTNIGRMFANVILLIKILVAGTHLLLPICFIYSLVDSFNQDISNWDTSSVTDMHGVSTSNSFNQDISNDVSSATDMNSMFMNNSNYNQDISDWDTSSVTTCLICSFSYWF